ncbi:MAG TPA: LamG domain-containing protein [Pyrinomonadaceae bacterium]|nr:LamG domain-containing protein [Pyrinomonadaceae bacterium]
MFNFKSTIALFAFTVLTLVFSTSATAQCVAPPSGMTDWWTADNNTLDIIGGENGSLQNGAGFGIGEVAQSFSLDGTNDFVQVPNDPAAAFNFTGSFSIDAWVFVDTPPAACSGGFSPIVSKWNDIGVNQRNYFLALDSGVIVNGCPTSPILRFDVSKDGLFLGGHSSIRTSNIAFPTNAWTHVAGVFNGTTHALDVYINGVLHNGPSLIDPSVSSPFVNNEPVLIGAGDLGSGLRHFFDGRIDEVELFNKALTATEIQSIFNAGPAGKIAPLVIDIKPDGVPNSINLKSKGNVPVAVLGTATFDVTTLNVGSIRFAGAPVITKNNGTFQSSFEDVNGDGRPDLVLHFDTQSLLLTSSSTEATLTGSTFGGRCVSGTDSVNIVH